MVVGWHGASSAIESHINCFYPYLCSTVSFVCLNLSLFDSASRIIIVSIESIMYEPPFEAPCPPSPVSRRQQRNSLLGGDSERAKAPQRAMTQSPTPSKLPPSKQAAHLQLASNICIEHPLRIRCILQQHFLQHEKNPPAALSSAYILSPPPHKREGTFIHIT